MVNLIKITQHKYKLLLTCLLLSSVAQATSPHSTSSYFHYIHFSGEAFGERVKSVMAHFGLQTTNTGNRSNNDRLPWKEVKDVYLQKSGDHFFGKALSQGETINVKVEKEAPVIQYWVEFENGAKWISPVYGIKAISMGECFGHPSAPYIAKCELMKKQAKLKFAQIVDSENTRSEKVSVLIAD